MGQGAIKIEKEGLNGILEGESGVNMEMADDEGCAQFEPIVQFWLFSLPHLYPEHVNPSLDLLWTLFIHRRIFLETFSFSLLDLSGGGMTSKRLFA